MINVFRPRYGEDSQRQDDGYSSDHIAPGKADLLLYIGYQRECYGRSQVTKPVIPAGGNNALLPSCVHTLGI